MPTFETSPTAKALKVIAAAKQLAAEQDVRGPHTEIAKDSVTALKQLVAMPMESLARLHDLILVHDTPAEAAAAIEAA